MWSIQVKRNIGTMKEYGSGEKVGEVELWLNKEQEELVEQLMDIVIDFTLQLSMPTSWTNILCLK